MSNPEIQIKFKNTSYQYQNETDSFDDLIHFIQTNFKNIPNNFQGLYLMYQDSDGDNITISCDSDISAMKDGQDQCITINIEANSEYDEQQFEEEKQERVDTFQSEFFSNQASLVKKQIPQFIAEKEDAQEQEEIQEKQQLVQYSEQSFLQLFDKYFSQKFGQELEKSLPKLLESINQSQASIQQQSSLTQSCYIQKSPEIIEIDNFYEKQNQEMKALLQEVQSQIQSTRVPSIVQKIQDQRKAHLDQLKAFYDTTFCMFQLNEISEEDAQQIIDKQIIAEGEKQIEQEQQDLEDQECDKLRQEEEERKRLLVEEERQRKFEQEEEIERVQQKEEEERQEEELRLQAIKLAEEELARKKKEEEYDREREQAIILEMSMKRKAEEEEIARIEAEKQRIEEEKLRIQAEEAARIEEQRIRQIQMEEQQRIEQEKLEEQRRIEEEEANRIALEEQQLIEEAKKLEAQRQALEEKKQVAEQMMKSRLKEEEDKQKQGEDERLKLEEEQRVAEEQQEKDKLRILEEERRIMQEAEESQRKREKQAILDAEFAKKLQEQLEDEDKASKYDKTVIQKSQKIADILGNKQDVYYEFVKDNNKKNVNDLLEQLMQDQAVRQKYKIKVDFE